MITNEWADDFFHGLAIDFWVAVAPAPDSDLPFLENVFGAPAGQVILDVACGAGRHSIALARRGYAVTRSPASISQPRASPRRSAARMRRRSRSNGIAVTCASFPGAIASTARSASATASAIAIGMERA